MPQITNLTIGPAVAVPVAADRLFRAVPSLTPTTKAWESSIDGSPELAVKLSASNTRKSSKAQSTMLRVHSPVIRSINNVETPVSANVVQVVANFAPQATAAEKQAALDLMIKAVKHAFFADVFVHGESMN